MHVEDIVLKWLRCVYLVATTVAVSCLLLCVHRLPLTEHVTHVLHACVANAGCAHYPCALDRSTCNTTSSGHICVCTPPYVGPISADGSQCYKFVLAIDADSHVSLGTALRDMRNSEQDSVEACRDYCNTVANSDCVAFGYNSELGECVVYLSLPTSVVPSSTALSIYVREVSILRWLDI
jgi:hypothetical protein